MVTVLVTGGKGLVGNAIKRVSNNYPKFNFIYTSSKDFDLTIVEDTEKMFLKYKPDYVIHLAANVGGLFKNMNQKVKMFEDNLMINYNVVKCCYKYKVEKLMVCLSTCIFPDNITYPIDENKLHIGPPHDSNEGYSYAKRMLEVHIRKYREQYNKDYFCVTPCNIYGPNDNFNLEDSHVIPGLIHKCYLAKINNDNFVVRGDGSPLRQFIYSDDLAKLILKLMEDNNLKESNIILAPTEEISIKKIAKIIKEKFKLESNIIFDTNYSNGQFKKTVGNDLLNKLIPEFEFKNINDGLKETIEWFNNNISNIRK